MRWILVSHGEGYFLDEVFAALEHNASLLKLEVTQIVRYGLPVDIVKSFLQHLPRELHVLCDLFEVGSALEVFNKDVSCRSDALLSIGINRERTLVHFRAVEHLQHFREEVEKDSAAGDISKKRAVSSHV